MPSTPAGEMSPVRMDDAAGRRKPKSSSARRFFLVLLLVAFLAGIFAFRNIGYWLTREDPLQKSDVIVVLSGGMPARAQESARGFSARIRARSVGQPAR